MDIVWYFTDQDFLPYPSIINSKHWASEGDRDTLVGEQWVNTPWPEKPRTVEGFFEDHQCGERTDFLEGQPWPYNGPPVQYDEDNIPYCCPRLRPPKLTSGGLPSATHKYTPPAYGLDCCDAPLNVMGQTTGAVMGAPFLGGDGLDLWFRWENPGDSITLTATGTLIPPVVVLSVWNGPTCGATSEVYIAPSSGTFCVGGLTPGTVCLRVQQFIAATQPVTVRVSEGGQCGPDLPIVGGGAPAAQTSSMYTDAASGGGEAGGAAGDVYGFTDAAAGGGEAGGSAGDLQAGTDAAAGGGEAGGSAGDVPSGTDAAAGGGEAGGSAGDLQAGTDAAAGGGEAGGSAGDLQTGTDAASGGGEAGGSAGDVPSGTDAAAGGGEAGGSAGDHFNPPPPVFHSVASGSLAGGFVAPAPATNGDLLVCFVGTTGGVTQTVATGWAQVAQSPTSSGGQTLGCYTRTRTGTDPKPITGSAGTYVCYAVTGWTAVDGSGVRADVTADMNLIAPSVAILANDLEFFGYVCVDSLNTATFPGDLTVTSITFAAPHLSVGRRTSAVNPTGTETATITAPREWATITVAVR